MIEQYNIREITLPTSFLRDTNFSSDALDADEKFDVCNTIVTTAADIAVEGHETLERLAFAVVERVAADGVGAGGCVDEDMVGGHSAREHVGIEVDTLDNARDGFNCVGDESCPDGDGLTEFERVWFGSKVELDL